MLFWKLRVEYESDPKLLDIRLPPLEFTKARPATFVWNHLVRGLVVEAKGHPLKTGDGSVRFWRDSTAAARNSAFQSP